MADTDDEQSLYGDQNASAEQQPPSEFGGASNMSCFQPSAVGLDHWQEANASGAHPPPPPRAPQGSSRSDDGERSRRGGASQSGDSHVFAAPRPHAGTSLRALPGYSPLLMCVPSPVTPLFPHGVETSGGWLDFRSALGDTDGNGQRTMRPVRAMCFNLPIGLFRPDAYRFKHCATNLKNPARATNIHALFSLLWTPLTKGWK